MSLNTRQQKKVTTLITSNCKLETVFNFTPVRISVVTASYLQLYRRVWVDDLKVTASFTSFYALIKGRPPSKLSESIKHNFVGRRKPDNSLALLTLRLLHYCSISGFEAAPKGLKESLNNQWEWYLKSCCQQKKKNVFEDK